MSQGSISAPRNVLSKRYWIITWNNPPEDWKNSIISLEPQWAVGQLEQSSQGTRHIQALLWYSNRQPNSFWKGKPCWSKAIYSHSVPETIAYVTKEETRIEGPFHYGKMPNHAKRATNTKRGYRDWEGALTCAKEGRYKEVEASILIPHLQNLQRVTHLFQKSTGTDQPRGLWVVGKPGMGKSYHVRKLYPEAYIKAQNKWWDGYYGQEHVLLDDLDKLGSCLSHYLKIWLDQYPFDGEIKGGHTCTNYTKFVITSNYWPSELFDDEVVSEAVSRRCIFMVFYGYTKFHLGTNLGLEDVWMFAPEKPGTKDLFDPYLHKS